MENMNMTRTLRLLLTMLALAAFAVAHSDEDALLEALKGAAAPGGWKWTGDIKTYDRSNLFELIDGEAELYFPYGFKRAIALSFSSAASPQDSIAAEVYEMGSVLDAFGVYSNYRDRSSKLVGVGTEGFAGVTQAMFYRDRFFVKVRAHGTSAQNQAAVLPCARAVSQVLSKNAPKPEELDLLEVPTVVQQTQQYFAQSVLGYDFFSTGLTADAEIGGYRVKVFIIMEITSRTARQALQRYEDFLKSSNVVPRWEDSSRGKMMEADDPLYKGVLVKQVGNMLVGVAKLPRPDQGIRLLEQLQARVIDKLKRNLPQERFNVPSPPPPAKPKG
jgi:hypothetical protein